MKRVRRHPERAAGSALRLRALVLGVALLAAPPLVAPLAAQEPSARLREQRDELERIRRERADLERQAEALRATVHDLSAEVVILDRRADAQARLVRLLDDQLLQISGDFDNATRRLQRAEKELTTKRGTLQLRLADIYKRGPMYTFEVMLTAKSFGELVSRYKYLHLLALRDRALVTRVEQLRNQVSRERDRLATLKRAIEENRSDKALEEARLRDLERERYSSLASVRRNAAQTEDRLVRLRRSEAELADAISSLEENRRRLEGNRATSTRTASALKTSDFGRLDWPVDGSLVYSFGKAQTASNATIRWNGVGISATEGTAVRSIAAGRIVSVRQLGTYGLTVIVDHGGGDYSIYGSLAAANVREQQQVAKGETLGSVGISDPDLPPHLHFEIRQRDGGSETPIAVDPAEWLKRKR